MKLDLHINYQHYSSYLSKILLWMSWFVLVASPDSSFSQSLNFKNISIDDGLSQNTVNAIIQDKVGFYWIATQEGLNRYDGYDFRLFLPNKYKPSKGPSGRWITSLSLDSLGFLWVGTNDQGVNRMNMVTEHFETVVHPELYNKRITALFSTDSLIYVSSAEGGVRRFKPNKDDSLVISDIRLIVPEIIDNRVVQVRQIYALNESTILFISPTHGIFSFDIQQEKLDLRLKTSTNFEPNCFIADTLSGNYYVGTRETGLWLTDRSLKRAQRLDILKNNIINCFLIYNDHLIVGTEDHGIYYINPRTNKILFNASAETHYYNGFKDNSIYTLFKDSNNAAWAGTFLNGLIYFHPEQNIFKNFYYIPGQSQSLKTNIIRGIAKRDHYLWIASREKGISILNLENERFETALENKINAILPQRFNNAVTFDDEHVYIGTFGAGLYKINLTDFSIEHFLTQKKGFYHLPNDEVRIMFYDKFQRLWAGLGQRGIGGLYIIDFKNRKSVYLTNEVGVNNSLNDNMISAIHQYNDSTYIIGTFTGISRITIQPNSKLEKESFKFENFSHELNNENSLSGNIISSIYQNKFGELWISSYGGGIDWVTSPLEPQFKVQRIINSDKITLSSIFGVLGDEKHHSIWASSNKGLIQYDTESHKFTTYNQSDGLGSSQFNQFSYLKLSDSLFAFGGTNGLTIFNPADVIAPNNHSIPIITSIEINGKTPDNDTTSALIRNITLQPNDHILSFEFAALYAQNMGLINFEYLLEGFDKDWVSAGLRRYVTYTNVPHGNYIFRVRTRSKTDILSAKFANLNIKVLAPFYLTKGFLLSSTFFVVLITLILIRSREQYLKRMNKELELKIVERTAKLQEKTKEAELMVEEAIKANAAKSEFLAGMSHELRTPLNAILGFSQILYRAKELPQTYRMYAETMFRSGSHLMEMINDVLDLSKIEAGKMEIHPQIVEIKTLITDIELMFDQQTAAKGITYSVEASQELPQYVEFDSNKIKQVLINLIGNSIKFTENGMVKVKFDYIKPEALPDFMYVREPATICGNDEMLFVSIQDTGKGVEEEMIETIFEPFRQSDTNFTTGTGLGLSICSKLIQMHKGTILVNSKPSVGSTFAFIIPTITLDPGSVNLLVQSVHSTDFELIDEATVLIVDDIESNILVLDSLMKTAGFKTICCTNGADALKHWETDHPDLILLDLRMPGISGKEVMQTIREQEDRQQTPIIAITASIFDEHRTTLIKDGFNDVIIKPFHSNDLFESIIKHARLVFRQSSHNDDNNQSDLTQTNVDQWVKLINELPESEQQFLKEAIISTDIDTILNWLDKQTDENNQWRIFQQYILDKDYRFLLTLSEAIN